MKNLLLWAALGLLPAAVGCSKPVEAESPAALGGKVAQEQPKAQPPGASAPMPQAAKDGELQINPNGTMATPGSKL